MGIENGFMDVLPSCIMAGCGLMLGVLLFLQINFLVKRKIKQNRIKIFQQQMGSNAVGYSIYDNPKFKKYIYNKLEENYWLHIKEKIKSKKEEALLFNSHVLTDEERLDQILDRINEVGQNKLTKQELDFLNYYSNKMQEDL
jgi:hypothetical protein